ncbi:MAG: SAF domain-containing protein [Chloroflexota bacterium]|nr:SAF domain-containing protein [Chloroflexota bacterium]
MRGNKTLVFIALFLILVVVGGYFWWQSRSPVEEVVEITPTEEPSRTVDIVVAAQSIARGKLILAEDNAVIMQSWPEDLLPLVYFDSLELVDGKFARMEIPRGVPVVPDMLGQPGGMLAVSGSSAALFETGRVGYAIPMDTQGAVGWAPLPGDHVDVLAAIKLIPVDTEFQSPLPNMFQSLPRPEEVQSETGVEAISGIYGRFENLPNGQAAVIYPFDAAALPNLVVQMTVQDAIVWHIGAWQEEEGEAQVPGTTTEATEEASGGVLGEGSGAQETPTPPPPAIIEPIRIDLITLLVTRQDAVVLKYLLEMGADLDLVLRPAGDTAPAITEPVWLRYVLDKYQIPDTMPDLPIAPTPVREMLELTPLATPAPEE